MMVHGHFMVEVSAIGWFDINSLPTIVDQDKIIWEDMSEFLKKNNL